MRQAISRCVLALPLLLASACLFSTTPPERQTPDPVPIDPDLIVVTGVVQLFDRTDGHTRAAVDWTVRATWYKPDPLRPGQYSVEQRSVVHSGNGGSYEVSLSSREVVAVEIQAVTCEFDPALSNCCVDVPPCVGPQCQIWTAARRLNVAPGMQLQQHLVVRCEHVP
jgi:hypothetical protein